MDLPQVRCLGRIVAVQFIQRICPQTISNKEYETFCRRWQWSLLRSHTMNEGRAEVDVKNGDQEHTMHKETSEYEDWYTHGNSGLARQSPTLRGSKKNKVRQMRLIRINIYFICYRTGVPWPQSLSKIHNQSLLPTSFFPEVLVKSHCKVNSDFQIVIMSQQLMSGV